MKKIKRLWMKMNFARIEIYIKKKKNIIKIKKENTLGPDDDDDDEDEDAESVGVDVLC